MASSVPDAEDRLLTLLEATFPTPSTVVRYGQPFDKVEEYELVYIDGSGEFSRAPAEQWREDDFEMTVIVEVFGEGDAPKTVSDRRWAIVEAIDAALLAADFYGYAAEDSSLDVEREPLVAYDLGYLAKSTLTISVTNRF